MLKSLELNLEEVTFKINISIYYLSVTCGIKTKHFKHTTSTLLFPKGGNWGSESLGDMIEDWITLQSKSCSRKRKNCYKKK